MKKLLFVLFFSFIVVAFPSVVRAVDNYIDSIYQVKTTQNVVYGQALGYNGKQETLLLDLYQPEDGGSEKRPLIIFIHGGSFVAGDKSVYTDNAVDLAKKGYVVASINYRLDTTHNTPYNAKSPDLDKPISSSRADTLMALRFLLSNPEYRINDKIVFVGGSSAGAITALYTAYSEEVDAKKIKAVYSIAGTVIDSDFDLIDKGDPPSILFSGTTDGIIPYEMAKGTVDKLKKVGVKAVLVTYKGEGHEIISKENFDIHQRLAKFLSPYAQEKTDKKKKVTPTVTSAVTDKPKVTVKPSITKGLSPTSIKQPTATPTFTPTPTTIPLTMEGLIENYLSNNAAFDLNKDGIVNGFDYFHLYKK